MAYRVNPDLADDLSSFGVGNANKCFNCGNCTAVCQLTGADDLFPRRTIRNIQLGLEERLLSQPDPWLCYYCGGCSDTCPREAEPGELMMVARRWLTSRYDWTGISRLLYRSKVAEVVLLLLLAFAVLAAFVLPADFGFRLLAQHPEGWQGVDLELFAPRHVVHLFDLVFAGVLSFFLLSNAARFFVWNARGIKAPLSTWLIKLWDFGVHFATQKRWTRCDSQRKTTHWLRHLLLVTAYGTMFIMVVVFLDPFQVGDDGWHWTSLLGYYATLILLGATSWMMLDRWRAREPIHKNSHSTDWLFLVLLFLTALTGILLHAARLADLAAPTYLMYVVHLMVAVPMLAIEVPFGKWAHLLYRPLAAYLAEVRAAAAPEEGPLLEGEVAAR